MVSTPCFHYCNRISGMVKYLDGLCSKTFKDEPRGWEIRYCQLLTRWEELYKLLEFVKRWSAISFKGYHGVISI